MLKLVRLENIILVESAQINFENGLNILTGETGAGKSAVMQALMLIAGLKGDAKMIRHGAEKGIVEAIFEMPPTAFIWSILEKAGFEVDPDEPLIIRREIHTHSKARSFINHQIAAISLIREIGDHLFDIASQHASLKLISESFQRSALDQYGDLEKEAVLFLESWEKEISLEKEITDLINSESFRLRELEACRYQIEEIDEARLKPEEDDALFQEYSALASSEERLSKAQMALNPLPIAAFNQTKGAIEQLSRLDPAAIPILELFNQAKIEMEEVVYQLSHYQRQISFQPERMQMLDERLQLLSKLKKKYGTTLEEVIGWRAIQKNKMDTLISADTKIEELKIVLTDIQEKNNLLAVQLTEKRKTAAELMQKEITQELREMNMPKAEFYIEISRGARNRHGEDKIDYLFYPNLGGKKVSVKEGASGGELARILLALKTVLAGKEGAATLIFDEVDANIGGETAKMLGQKLSRLGKNTQVIAITHFPQVAMEADHHLRVRKVEINGSTRSLIETLAVKDREGELARMVGQS